ncbi:MAG: AzlD domain-containing protein [Acetobacteraceae bacterium]|nr:AzlD domain-containing protein [Acetobacteraceae bacterium]
MSLRWDVLAAIIGMALATYLCRAGGYALLRAFRPPPFVEAMLAHMPGCIFVAFVIPTLIAGGSVHLAAGAATLAVMMATRNITAAIAGGVAVAWLLRGG